ncbi:MAG TPA: hypothetical protein VK020_04915, partial [Microlunatus sp.]|nr:hypothetical protein [Microlunatus sp.]
MTETLTPTESRLARVIIVLGVVLVAAGMRPALTSVGPVLDRIGLDTGLGPTGLGLLGAVPLLAFAAVSPLVHRISHATAAIRAGVAHTASAPRQPTGSRSASGTLSPEAAAATPFITAV